METTNGFITDNKDFTKKLVKKITDFVNSYSLDQDMFNDAMSREHRTLQQSFTRLCLKWMEYVASDEYRFDGRNEASHDLCDAIITYYKDATAGDINPSQMLPLI